MSYTVDDKVLIVGKVQEVIENEDGKFYRLKVKHSGGSMVISVEEQYIRGGYTESKPTDNTTPTNTQEPTPDPEPEQETPTPTPATTTDAP